MEKRYRLKHNSSFQYIFKNGKKIHSDILIIFIVPAANKKLGVSVSKKVGNSVVRSRIKRRIKEAFRQTIHKIKGEYNFVIVAKKEIREASFEIIQKTITDLLKKAEIYKEETNEVSL